MKEEVTTEILTEEQKPVCSEKIQDQNPIEKSDQIAENPDTDPEDDQNPEPDPVTGKNGNEDADASSETPDICDRIFFSLFDILSFNNYRRLHFIPAFLLAIALSPFLLITICLAIAFIMVYDVFIIIAAPADYMVSVLKKDAGDQKLQLITFILGYPFALIFRFVCAILYVLLFVLHLLINTSGAIYSLGGMHFDNILSEPSVDFDEPLNTEPFGVVANIIAVFVALAIILSCCVLPIVFLA